MVEGCLNSVGLGVIKVKLLNWLIISVKTLGLNEVYLLLNAIEIIYCNNPDYKSPQDESAVNVI